MSTSSNYNDFPCNATSQYNGATVAKALFPKVVLGREINNASVNPRQSVKDAMDIVFNTLMAYNMFPILFNQKGDVKVVSDELKKMTINVMNGHNSFRSDVKCQQFIYCSKCWKFCKDNIADTYAVSIACVYVDPSVKENGKEYGGVKVLKVYPHNRQCTTPYKHLTYVKMQTVGTGYDLFQFNKDVILGTLLKDLVDSLHELHRNKQDPGKYNCVVCKWCCLY